MSMYARCRFVLLLSLFTSIGISDSQAQSKTISGKVTDSITGESLPFANIVVDGTSIGTSSNVDGFFSLIGVAGNQVVLRIAYIGYESLSREIDLSKETTNIEIKLLPSSIGLDEVDIVSDSYHIMKAAEKISQVTISPKDLEMLPSIGEVDIFRSLQLLPGVSGTNEGSAGLFVRGGTPDQNLVLLDGMTVYHVDHFFGFFSAFNADAIKDVQLFKGAFPAKYGGRTSSVVDLTGKSGNANEASGGLGVNLLSAQGSVEYPITSKLSMLLSGRRSFTDFIRSNVYNNIFNTLSNADSEDTQTQAGLGRFRNAQVANVDPDFYFYDFNAKLSFRPSTKDNLALSFYNGKDFLDRGRVTDRNAGGVGGGGGQQNFSVVNDLTDLTDWGNFGTSGKWSRQWDSRLYTNFLAAYSEYFSDYNRINQINRVDLNTDSLTFSRRLASLETNKVKDLTLRMDNEFQFSNSHKLGFGAQLTRSDVGFSFVRDDTLTVLDRDQTATQVATYLQDTWKVFPALEFTLGARATYYSGTDESFIEPRASLSLNLSDQLRLKGAFGKFNQFTTRVVTENITEGSRDFWLLADGEQVEIESSTHYVLGATYRSDGWLFDTEFYHKDISGLSEFSLRFQRSGIQEERLFFGGTGTARGVELLVQKTAGKNTGWLSYTLGEVKHLFPELNEGEAFPALHDQTHELKWVQTYTLGALNFSSTWTLASGKPYTSPIAEYSITLLDGTENTYIGVGEKNAERLPSYHRLDLSSHYRIDFENGSSANLGLSLFNAYNRKNVWYREFDFSESPLLVTDVTFIGFTPTLSLRFDF